MQKQPYCMTPKTDKCNNLFLITCYGATPHFSLMKYINESRRDSYCAYVLPAVKIEQSDLIIKYLKIKDGVIEDRTVRKKKPLIFPVYLYQYYHSFVFIAKEFFFKKRKYNNCFAEANFNATIMFFLKKIGIVETTIFINGDLIARNSKSKPYAENDLLGGLYNYMLISLMKLTRRIGNRNDIVWYPNETPKKWDVENNMIPHREYILLGPQISEYSNLYANSVRKSWRFSYLGQLTEISGIYLVVDAIMKLSEKYNQDCVLDIIGGSGFDIDKLRVYAKKKNVEQSIVFHGFVRDPIKVYEILSSTIASFMMYKPSKNNISIADVDNGKVKEYINASVPVIMSEGTTLVEKKIGHLSFSFPIEFNEGILSDTIYKIGSLEEHKYKDIINDIVKYSEQNDYVLKYNQMFSDLNL